MGLYWKVMSLTQTVQKPFARPSRTYDYLDDTNFVVSSDRDHAWEVFKAHTNIQRISLCSSLQNDVQLSATPPEAAGDPRHHGPRSPPHVIRHWRGYANQARETLIQYRIISNIGAPQK